MTRRLPSLTSLRTFEAAARNLSFAKAAEELSVTPAAVGFQIRQLEEELDSALFKRKHRGVELTLKGRELAVQLGPAFKSIESAWNTAHEPKTERVFKASGPAKAVHSWVLPALSDAQSRMPDVRIAWDLTKQSRDVANGEVDLAIRWSMEPQDDLHWAPLLRTWFTPLVRADVSRFVKTPNDLEKQGLIDVEFVLDPGNVESAWTQWFRVMGLDPPTEYAVSCADTVGAVETALATGHVAIGGSFLAYDQLVKGELIAPFGTAVTPNSRFWLVCRKGWESTPEFKWILDAVKQGAGKFDVLTETMELFRLDGKRVQEL